MNGYGVKRAERKRRRRKDEASWTAGEEHCWHKETKDNIKIHYSSQFLSTIHNFRVEIGAKITLNMNVVKGTILQILYTIIKWCPRI